MIVRTLDEVVGSDRDVAGEGWRSRRLLLRRDQLGFSLHDTTVAAGTELTLQYKHHLEACYLLAGEAELTDLATGEKHAAAGRLAVRPRPARPPYAPGADGPSPGCVFNPALTGGEVHDADGSFPPPPTD